MDLSARTVWQQASGQPPRSYADVCLRVGVILNGYDEAWASEAPMPDDFLMQDALSKLAEGSRQWIERLACSDRKRNDLMRFCHEMKDGDIVVLRRGRSEVFGVGAVEGDHNDARTRDAGL